MLDAIAEAIAAGFEMIVLGALNEYEATTMDFSSLDLPRGTVIREAVSDRNAKDGWSWRVVRERGAA